MKKFKHALALILSVVMVVTTVMPQMIFADEVTESAAKDGATHETAVDIVLEEEKEFAFEAYEEKYFKITAPSNLEGQEYYVVTIEVPEDNEVETSWRYSHDTEYNYYGVCENVYRDVIVIDADETIHFMLQLKKAGSCTVSVKKQFAVTNITPVLVEKDFYTGKTDIGELYHGLSVQVEYDQASENEMVKYDYYTMQLANGNSLEFQILNSENEKMEVSDFYEFPAGEYTLEFYEISGWAENAYRGKCEFTLKEQSKIPYLKEGTNEVKSFADKWLKSYYKFEPEETGLYIFEEMTDANGGMYIDYYDEEGYMQRLEPIGKDTARMNKYSLKAGVEYDVALYGTNQGKEEFKLTIKKTPEVTSVTATLAKTHFIENVEKYPGNGAQVMITYSDESLGTETITMNGDCVVTEQGNVVTYRTTGDKNYSPGGAMAAGTYDVIFYTGIWGKKSCVKSDGYKILVEGYNEQVNVGTGSFEVITSEEGNVWYKYIAEEDGYVGIFGADSLEVYSDTEDGIVKVEPTEDGFYNLEKDKSYYLGFSGTIIDTEGEESNTFSVSIIKNPITNMTLTLSKTEFEETDTFYVPNATIVITYADGSTEELRTKETGTATTSLTDSKGNVITYAIIDVIDDINGNVCDLTKPLEAGNYKVLFEDVKQGKYSNWVSFEVKEPETQDPESPTTEEPSTQEPEVPTTQEPSTQEPENPTTQAPQTPTTQTPQQPTTQSPSSGTTSGGEGITDAVTPPTQEVSKTATGTIHKVSGATYKVVNETTSSVAYQKPVSKNKTSVTIPKTVKLNGKSFKVTEIDKNAFKNSKKLKKIKIGDNVKTIGASAFSGCKALTSVNGGKNLVTISSSAFANCTKLRTVSLSSKKLKTIEKKAFYKCKKLEKVTLKTTKLTKKTVGAQAFKGIKSNCTFKVPKSKVKAYETLLRSKGAGKKIKVKK